MAEGVNTGAQITATASGSDWAVRSPVLQCCGWCETQGAAQPKVTGGRGLIIPHHHFSETSLS